MTGANGLRFSRSPLFQLRIFEAPVAASTDTLRIVGMNLHNYFNGDGNGLGFPTPRGAKTYEDFQQQRSRIGAAIGVLDPHVLAVMELENDGFGPTVPHRTSFNWPMMQAMNHGP